MTFRASISLVLVFAYGLGVMLCAGAPKVMCTNGEGESRLDIAQLASCETGGCGTAAPQEQAVASGDSCETCTDTLLPNIENCRGRAAQSVDSLHALTLSVPVLSTVSFQLNRAYLTPCDQPGARSSPPAGISILRC